MSVALKKLTQTISEDLRNAISSPALESGVMRLETLDGQMILPCGQAPAPAKVSVQAGKGEASQISVTYGLHGSGSLESAHLTQSLANRFRQKTDSLGSTLFRLTWKERVTPSGRSIPALRASARRTSETAFTSWPTPSVNNFEQADQEALLARRERCKATTGNGNGFGMTLGNAAQLATWTTPTAQDHSRGGRPARPWDTGVPLSQQAALASWSSPKATDGSGGRTTQTKGGGNVHLDRRARLAAWSTPNAGDGTGGKISPSRMNAGTGISLKAQAANLLTDSGETQNGSTAETKNTGQLNPAHSRWLQGLPKEWDVCADTVTRSVRRKRKHS